MEEQGSYKLTNILIAEDSPVQARKLQYTLEKFGFIAFFGRKMV